MSFQKLKKARKTDLSKLTQEIEKLNTSTNKNGNNSGGDERLWKLTVDKFCDFFLLLMVKIFRGFAFGIMGFKVPVVGTLRTR